MSQAGGNNSGGGGGGGTGNIQGIQVNDPSNNLGIGERPTGPLAAITTGAENTIIGYGSGHLISSGTGNTGIGVSNFGSLTTGTENTTIGVANLAHLVSGKLNLALGNNTGINYTGSESSNILIQNIGVLGESNVLRIGTQGNIDNTVNQAFIAGITGVTVSLPQQVVIDSATGQLGVASTSIPKFSAYVSTPLVNVTGDNTIYTVPFDTALFNVTSSYNTTTGVFTAPADGYYNFSACLLLQSLTVDFTAASIKFVVGSGFQSPQGFVNPGVVSATTNGFYSISGEMTIALSSTDTVIVTILVSNSTKTIGIFGDTNRGYSIFSGYMIS